MDSYQPYQPEQSREPFRPDPGPFNPLDAGPRPLKTFPGAAWVVIVLLTVLAVAMHSVDLSASKQSQAHEGDGVGIVVAELQGKYIIGAAEWTPDRRSLYDQIRELNGGSIGQRYRFIILAAELAGPAEAAEALGDLEQLIEQETASDPKFTLSETQQAVHEVLRKLYAGIDADEEFTNEILIQRVASLSTDERSLLIDELGWFGKLALAPEGGDVRLRDEAMTSARLTLAIIIGMLSFAGLLGVGGFVGLVVMIVMVFTRRITSGFAPPAAPHGIYAETFAFWMLVFLVLQVAAAIGMSIVPAVGMVAIIAAFFASLSALAWPVMRGVSWTQVRHDVGLGVRQNLVVDVAVGAGSYCMGLPLLAVGFLITLAFMLVQQALQPERAPFEPEGGPAHPVIAELGGDNWIPKLLILFLGAVTAPIVEEIMFRGVLYSHLRGATAGVGLAGSILASGAISAFIFAIIHPQGWVAVPALMSLAFAFSLAREWWGSVLPCIVMHGISNFLVMGTLIALLSV